MERKQISLRLPKEMFERLEKEATRLGYSINTYIQMMIEKGMKEKK